MWRSRRKSNSRVPTTSQFFSQSFSFKDIESLYSSDHHHHNNNSDTSSTSPNTKPNRKEPSIFHRVLRTTAVLRAFSPSSSPPHNAQPHQSDPSIPIPAKQEPHNANQSEPSISIPGSEKQEPTPSSPPLHNPNEPKPSSPPHNSEVGQSEPSISIPEAQNGEPASSSPSLHNANQSEPSISILGAEKRVVVYLTSLRVVRSTFEDCRTVQSILRGFRVTIDERDLSMDSGFMKELQKILKVDEKTKLTLPRVFIGGRYIGGAEEVRQLNETGDLKKFVEGLPAAEPGVCDGCSGYRFILCDECSGSHKCYAEKSSVFRSCMKCNENGLIRCPSCSCEPISTF